MHPFVQLSKSLCRPTKPNPPRRYANTISHASNVVDAHTQIHQTSMQPIYAHQSYPHHSYIHNHHLPDHTPSQSQLPYPEYTRYSTAALYPHLVLPRRLLRPPLFLPLPPHFPAPHPPPQS
jgi:hypothetical protein